MLRSRYAVRRLCTVFANANGEFRDQDEYTTGNVFWVPPEARWQHLQDNAKQPTIGKLVDDAMVAIERDNPRLKGILPKDYARPGLDKHRLGELIDLIGTIGLGDAEGQTTRTGKEWNAVQVSRVLAGFSASACRSTQTRTLSIAHTFSSRRWHF